MRPPWLAVPALLMLGAALLSGCGSGTGYGDGAGAGPGGQRPSGTVTVFAAASLTESFTDIGERFEAANPGTTVRLNFGASSALAESIAQGAPADVFASASAGTMDIVVAAGDAAGPRTFARNELEIAVPPDNPAGVAALTDLARPRLKLAVCQQQVPCGAVARRVFDRARLDVRPVTFGADVRAVLTAVQLGEVDAGLVYRTDVRAAGAKVRGIAIPPAQNASTSYPIAVLSKAPNRAAATAFAGYVLSAAGTAVLTEAGFRRP